MHHGHRIGVVSVYGVLVLVDFYVIGEGMTDSFFRYVLVVGDEPIYVGPFDTVQEANDWVAGTHTPKPYSVAQLEPPMIS